MPKQNVIKVWRTPLLLAALTFFGLLSALLGNGAWKIPACIALVVPLFIIIQKSSSRKT